MGGVGDKGKLQGMLFCEFAVRLGRINADSYRMAAGSGQFVVVVAETAGFGRTAGGVVFGVEIESYALVGEIAQTYFFSVFVGAEQIGYLVSGLYHIRYVFLNQ